MNKIVLSVLMLLGLSFSAMAAKNPPKPIPLPDHAGFVCTWGIAPGVTSVANDNESQCIKDHLRWWNTEQPHACQYSTAMVWNRFEVAAGGTTYVHTWEYYNNFTNGSCPNSNPQYAGDWDIGYYPAGNAAQCPPTSEADSNGGCYCPPAAGQWSDTYGICTSPSKPLSSLSGFFTDTGFAGAVTVFQASSPNVTVAVNGAYLPQDGSGNFTNSSVTGFTVTDVTTGTSLGAAVHTTDTDVYGHTIDVYTLTSTTAIPGDYYKLAVSGTTTGTLPYAYFVATTPDQSVSVWKPALTFGGASSGITYSAQEGTYTLNGNEVTLHFKVVLTSKGSSTGAAALSGLPFPAQTSYAWGGMGGVVAAYANMSGLLHPLIIQVGTGPLAYLSSLASGTGYGYLTNTNFTNTSSVYGTFIYLKQ